MSDISLYQLKPDDWQRSKTIRLRALADAPDAFGSLLADEEKFEEADWRRRLARADAATFVACRNSDGEDIGVAAGAHFAGKTDRCAGLFSMWVEPSSRGTGVGEALVQRVIDWARAHGFTRLYVDVADENPHADALYARMGFEKTGETTTLPPPRQHILEHERMLLL